MGTIAKTYTTVIVSGLRANASSVRRAYDDVYDMVNGGLDAANLSATFKAGWFAASQISFPSNANITSSNVRSAIEEVQQELTDVSASIRLSAAELRQTCATQLHVIHNY